jgi:bifunctional UDP-N-acetylglucosamine pyrophosphorylase/glucosamine-1-phosphate N-acetyltransferase
MQAIIMAAGEGTRLRPLTLDTPKPMLRVGGLPILERTFDALPDAVDSVILVVGYLSGRIVEHFGSSWKGRAIAYVEQRELKGTGHAVARCEPVVGGRFLVLNGDDLYARADLERLAACDLGVLAMEIDDAGRFGTLALDGRGALSSIVEGGRGGKGLVNAGAYALDRRFFDYPLVPIKNGAEFGLPQTIAGMTGDHAVSVVRASFWFPIGFPEDLEKADRLLARRPPVRA